MTFTVHPKIPGDFSSLLDWLQSNNLCFNAQDTPQSETKKETLYTFPIPTLSQGQLDDIPKHKITDNISIKQLLRIKKDSKPIIKQLHWPVVPTDAVACYNPFHSHSDEKWGIYFFADNLLSHHQQLYEASKDFLIWDYQTLLHLFVFEVFNHEFFHHIVECTATYIEILQGAAQTPFPVYFDYKIRQQNGIDHPHHPLEEALANAYAYNAFGFISRQKAGYKTATVKLYQAAIRKHWLDAPKGYCAAENYIYGKHNLGAACLLEQLLNSPNACHRSPLPAITQHLMPSGYTTLFTKPKIPTYVIGTQAAITELQRHLPALNATYSQLFWAKETTEIDRGIQRAEQHHTQSING
ncbi:MAG: hypothetical protein OXE99_14890 [Cellvibrionales bacterium]|nr:hypothetical protein [Cellvibrionales bacterium]